MFWRSRSLLFSAKAKKKTYPNTAKNRPNTKPTHTKNVLKRHMRFFSAEAKKKPAPQYCQKWARCPANTHAQIGLKVTGAIFRRRKKQTGPLTQLKKDQIPSQHTPEMLWRSPALCFDEGKKRGPLIPFKMGQTRSQPTPRIYRHSYVARHLPPRHNYTDNQELEWPLEPTVVVGLRKQWFANQNTARRFYPPNFFHKKTKKNVTTVLRNQGNSLKNKIAPIFFIWVAKFGYSGFLSSNTLPNQCKIESHNVAPWEPTSTLRALHRAE